MPVDFYQLSSTDTYRLRPHVARQRGGVTDELIGTRILSPEN